MVEAVLFDLDGTLLDRDASVEQFVSLQYDRLSEHLSHIPKNNYIARFINLDCHDHVWKDKIYQSLVSEFAIGMSWREHYGQVGQQNLIVRKTSGKDEIRYLHGRCCGHAFSERKQTDLWNSKIPETRAIDIAELISEGVSIKGTARKTRSHASTVRRLALRSGQQAQAFQPSPAQPSPAQQLSSQTLEMDERHGYVESKAQPIWDAVTIDPQSKFIVQLAVGPRDTGLIEPLMRHSAERLAKSQDILLMTDGEAT